MVLCFFNLFAQKGDYAIGEKTKFIDRIYFGGGFGFSGNSNTMAVSVSPLVGYMISNKLSAGIGATYQYFKHFKFTDNQYGGLFFARMNLSNQLFGYIEYSFINQLDYHDGKSRVTIDRFPIGIGISRPVNVQSSLNIIVAYDLLHESNRKYYNSPWVIHFNLSL